MRHAQAIQQFVVTDFILVEEIMAIFIDGDTDVLALGLRLTRNTGGQVHLDAFQMHLAQAHHHETGEQEEHDVDQRNDLDPRLLVWDR